MVDMSPQASQFLERALDLSAKERGALIARLIDSLDEGPADEGVEQAWEAEINRRVDDLRSGKAKTIPWEEVRRRAAALLRDGRT
jgi:putative addiction module component (TIGR02574 family)